MWVDDSQAITIPIRTADQNGSYAFLALDTTLLDQPLAQWHGFFASASPANLPFDPPGQAITFELSLADFAAAVDRV